MACEDTGREPVPIVIRPAEAIFERAEHEGGIGDAPSHDDIGALAQRLGDRIRA